MELQGWVKLHRKLVDWQWYKDANASRLFIHLLLSANHKPAKWQTHTIARGQKITSFDNLAFELGLTVQQIRTALGKLKSTGEVTSTSTSKFTLITITNYESYQETNSQDNKPITNEQQTDNKPITTNKNEKNKYNEKNERENTALKLYEFCLAGFKEEDQQAFMEKPDDCIPDSFGNEWVKAKGRTDGMFEAWGKFYRYYTSPDNKHPERKDWATMWINWLTNERIYAIQKK